MITMEDVKERKKLLTLIRNEGNDAHNKEVLENGRGELHVARVSGDDNDPSNFVPCHVCLLWVSKSRLTRHKCTDKTKRPSLIVSKGLVLAAKKGYTEGMVKVLSELAEDEVGRLIRRDSLLLAVLHHQTKSGLWVMRKWRDQARIRLRYGARLLLRMQETFPGQDLRALLTAENFELMADCAVSCATDSEGKTHPEVSLKIGHFINTCIKRKYVQAIQERDEATIRDMEYLTKVKSADWSDVVSTGSHFLISKRNRGITITLPTKEDVAKFASAMASKLEKAVDNFEANPNSREAYRQLQEVALIWTIAFNRKRGGEVSTMTLTDYERGLKTLTEQQKSEEMYAKLTPAEKKLAQSSCLISVIGKNNRNVYVLLDPTMKAAFDLIMEHRNVGGILPENEFIFAKSCTKDGFIRHSALLKEFQDEIGVKNMSTRQMRKYLATSLLVSTALTGYTTLIEYRYAVC
jgi:hypothetical protein